MLTVPFRSAKAAKDRLVYYKSQNRLQAVRVKWLGVEYAEVDAGSGNFPIKRTELCHILDPKLRPIRPDELPEKFLITHKGLYDQAGHSRRSAFTRELVEQWISIDGEWSAYNNCWYPFTKHRNP